MSYAAEAVRSYLGRTGQPRDLALDGHYQYEWAVLRDILGRLEVILDDEGIDRETAMRVIRCMLYGAPSVAAAEERMRTHERMVEMIAKMPPDSIFLVPGPTGAEAET